MYMEIISKLGQYFKVDNLKYIHTAVYNKDKKRLILGIRIEYYSRTRIKSNFKMEKDLSIYM